MLLVEVTVFLELLATEQTYGSYEEVLHDTVVKDVFLTYLSGICLPAIGT